MPKNTKRLSILGPDEILALLGLPQLTDEDREIYFSLDPNENLAFELLRHTSTKLLLLLQLGYFKISQQFFVFSWQDITIDRDYLMCRYFSQESTPAVVPSKNTRITQQKIILRCQNCWRD